MTQENVIIDGIKFTVTAAELWRWHIDGTCIWAFLDSDRNIVDPFVFSPGTGFREGSVCVAGFGDFEQALGDNLMKAPDDLEVSVVVSRRYRWLQR